MADPDPLDDRPAALSAGPVPPLPGPAQARAHGDRRRRRQQLALGCAAVVAAATLGGGVALLTGGNGSDALRTADAPTASPSAAPSPTPTPDEPCPAPSPAEVASGPYCSTLTIEPDPPSAPPTEDASPEPAPDPWEVSDGFLSPQQAAQAELPGWGVDETHRPGKGPLLDPCVDEAFHGDPVARVDRAMRSERETGGSNLVQQVLRYAGETEAAAAFDAFTDSVARCPDSPALGGPPGEVNRLEVAGSGRVDGARTLLVRQKTCSNEHGCLDSYRTYFLLVQDGDGLTDAFYGLGEDGDPERFAARLLDAVAQQLSRTVRG